MKNLIEQANETILTVNEYLNNNEKVWNTPHNLKLYEVFDYCIGNKIPEHIFADFCSDAYNDFREYAKSEYIDLNKTLKYIGRSSSFYLSDLHESEIYNRIETLNAIILENFNLPIVQDDFKINKDIITEYDLQYIIDNFLDNAIYYLKDAVKIHNYISDFKDKQLKCFIEYVQNNY
jgi:signal transduction histidine kinase